MVSIFVGIRQAKNIRENIDAPPARKRAPMVFLLCITAYLVVAWIDACDHHAGCSDKIFPLAIGTVTLVGCVALLDPDGAQARNRRGVHRPRGGRRRISARRTGCGRTLAWFLGLLVLSGALRLHHRAGAVPDGLLPDHGPGSWLAHGDLCCGCGVAFMMFLAAVLGRDFPPGLLQEYARSALAVHVTQRAIPYLFLRGGTSRGPYFQRADLPEDRDVLSEVLISVIGAGHAAQHRRDRRRRRR